MCNENIRLVSHAAHTLTEPTFPDKECIVSPKFHRHCLSLHTLFRPQILVHHTASVEIFGGHAHLAMNTFI